MFPNAKASLNLRPNTIDLVEKRLFPNCWNIIKDGVAQKKENQLNRRKPFRKFIRTQAQKGGCRISR